MLRSFIHKNPPLDPVLNKCEPVSFNPVFYKPQFYILPSHQYAGLPNGLPSPLPRPHFVGISHGPTRNTCPTNLTLATLITSHMQVNKYIFFFYPAFTTLYEFEPPPSGGSEIRHKDAPQSVGLLWKSDRPVAETIT